jgi:hypothetical protein
MVAKDPDGISIRCYSRETHDRDAESADLASPWVN